MDRLPPEVGSATSQCVSSILRSGGNAHSARSRECNASSVAASADDDKQLATALLERWNWGAGESKSQLEREIWDDGSSHGRRFDRFILRVLGVSTNKPAKSSTSIKRLERQVRSLGGQPVTVEPCEWEIQLAHSREAMLAALRVWNDPVARFRTGAFSLLLVTAWNALALARLQRDGIDWWKVNEQGDPVRIDGVLQAMDTSHAMARAFTGDARRGVRENVRVWTDIRNSVAHRYLPVLDIAVIPEAQASVLDFENIVVETFGDEFALQESLSVPLQLSGFRDPGVLASRRKLLAALPPDVQSLLTRVEAEQPELLADPTYRLRIAFVPTVAPSHNGVDAIAHFVRPGEVTEELDEVLSRFVVLPKTLMDNCRYGGKEATKRIRARIKFGFSTADHAELGRRLGVRSAAGQPEKTHKPEYAKYVEAAKIYVYSDAWIDLAVSVLIDPEYRFRGHGAVAKDSSS